MAKKLTNRELSKAPYSIAAEMMKSKYEKEIQKVVSKCEALIDENGELKEIIKSMAKTPNYYDNSNTPPSADPLEWKQGSRQIRGS